MITINEKEYAEELLTPEQKHLLAQVNSCRAKIQTSSSDLQIAQVAEQQFSQALIESVESDATDT